MFKTNNLNFVDSKSLNVVKYLKEIRLIKHWRNFTRSQIFNRKKKGLANNFLFSKQTSFKNIFKSFTSHFYKTFNFYDTKIMKNNNLVFGDKQIQSFIPFFTLCWNSYNEDMKTVLKQIIEFLLNLNNVLLKEIDNQKNFFNLAQNNKNKYKGNELKTIESILKFKTQSMNFITSFFDKIIKLFMISVKSSNLYYFQKFLKNFLDFFKKPDKFKHEIYFSISNEKAFVPKPTYETFSKRIEEFLKTFINDFTNRNPILYFKEKSNFLVSNPTIKKNLPSILKILDNKLLYHKDQTRTSSIQKIINESLYQNINKIKNIIVYNEKEVKKLFEIKELIENINIESFDIDKFIENYTLIENFNLKLNEKYVSDIFIFDFTEAKNDLNKLREMIIQSIEEKLGKIKANSTKIIKEKLKGISISFEKLLIHKNNFCKQVIIL